MSAFHADSIAVAILVAASADASDHAAYPQMSTSMALETVLLWFRSIQE
jgi:hypothetical protein